MGSYDEEGNWIDTESNAIGNLRDADKAKAKRIKELETELATATTSLQEYATKARSTDLAGLLKAKGIDPGVSKFLADVDPTQEAVDAWLTENGKFIGYDPSKGTQNGEEGSGNDEENSQVSAEMAELQANLQRVQNGEANAAPGLLGGNKQLDAIAKLGANATSFEDVVKGLKESHIL